MQEINASKRIRDRIARAVLKGWCFRFVRPPTATSRGAVWVSRPDEYDIHWVEKAMGKNWIEECLNNAGVPE